MRALVAIGVGSYDDPTIADLKYASADAARFADVGQTIFGVTSEATLVLNSTAGLVSQKYTPTKSNILRAFRELSNLSNDRILEYLYIFFSGHGMHSPFSSEEVLATSETVIGDLDETALRFNVMVDRIRQIKARHTVLFLDACRNFRVRSKGCDDTQPRISRMCPSGMVTFHSCQPGAMSFEADTYQHGVFTYVLCNALSPGASCATVRELDRLLHELLPKACSAVGLPRQVPYTRLEPLELIDLVIVAESATLNLCRPDFLRNELRSNSVPQYAGSKPLPDRIILAVDFGTSFSAVGIYMGNDNELLVPCSDGRIQIPSEVRIADNGDYSVGWDARRGMGGVHITSPKRALIENRQFDIKGHALSAPLACALILKSLRQNAAEFIGRDVKDVVVSIPADFGSETRRRVLDAYKLAGFNVLRAVSESSAVALLGYSPSKLISDAQTTVKIPEVDKYEFEFLVVDLGGGTLDVAVIVAEGAEGDALYPVCEVRYGDGDKTLGGLDFDRALAKMLESRLMIETQRANLHWLIDNEMLLLKAEEMKRALSHFPSTNVIFGDAFDEQGNFCDVTLTITREEAGEIVKSLVDRIRDLIDRVLKKSGCKPRILVLGGQGSKIFWVRHMILHDFPDVPIVSKYQESAVVRGLSRQAGVLSGARRNLLLLDMTYRGYSIMVSHDRKDRFLINSNPEVNQLLTEVVDLGTTIPTLKSIDGNVLWGTENETDLRIYETYLSGQNSFLGSIRIGRKWLKDEMKITIDIDANSSVFMFIANSHSGIGERWKHHDLKRFAIFELQTGLNCQNMPEEPSNPSLKLPEGYPRSNEIKSYTIDEKSAQQEMYRATRLRVLGS
jgi:molecular chaperone DnaK (HSP70)